MPMCLHCLLPVLILSVGFHTRHVGAQLDGTCHAEAGGVCTGEANADLCDSAAVPVCICNINYEESGSDCILKACTTGPVTTCGANTACTANSKCSCAINYEVVHNRTPYACTAIQCTAANASTKCTDKNSHCDTQNRNNCQCNSNFDGTNLAACAHKSPDCTSDSECTKVNSACHVGTGCDCDTLYITDKAGEGWCAARKTCSPSGVTASTCGTNTVCKASAGGFKCACLANYRPASTGCVEKTCTSASIVDDCGPGYYCVDSKCKCATGFVPRGSSCQKECCSDATVCGTNAACVDGACMCNANYVGDGATCTQLTGCSVADLSVCHPNSKCSADSSGNCTCADTHTTSGTLCKKDCSADPSVCHKNAECTHDVCQCNVNYEGDGAICIQKTCINSDAASCRANSKCVTDRCMCANNYVPIGQICVACPPGMIGDGTECRATSTTSQENCGNPAITPSFVLLIMI